MQDAEEVNAYKYSLNKGFTVVPATAGPLCERPPALAGHFCDVPTTLPC